MAGKMFSSQVAEKYGVIVEIFLTEVTPRVSQYLSLRLGGRITVLYVLLEMPLVVLSLLLFEYQSSFLASRTQYFLMFYEQVFLISLFCRELVLRITALKSANE